MNNKNLSNNYQLLSKHSKSSNSKRKCYTENPQIVQRPNQIQISIQQPNQSNRKIQKRMFTSETDIISHDANCVCQQCDCGRHMCKLSCLGQKPNIKIASIYMKTFKKPSKKHLKQVMYSNSSQKSIQKCIEITSKTIYDQSFNKANKQCQKITHNHNMLQQTTTKVDNVPFMKLTSYNQNFVGHRMDNQYVRYKESKVNNFLSFKSATSYRNDFCSPETKQTKLVNYRNTRPVSSQQHNRQKQLTQAIMRRTFKSTYQNSFTNKNNNKEENQKQFPLQNIKIKRSYDDFAIVASEKDDNNGKLITNYMKDFKMLQSNVCPAKTKIMSMNKSDIQAMRQTLKQNSNFKQIPHSVIQ